MARTEIIILVLIGVALVMVGLMSQLQTSNVPPYHQYGWQEPGYMYPDDYDPSTDANIVPDFNSNGELIYYTGFNENGQKIPVTGGPHWLYVHGGSCVSCHGVDGKGGVPIMMGTSIPSDIRYETLTAEDEHEDEHDEHPPYTDETIKKAIRDGVNPAGEDLDYTMPEWDMSDEDLDDLIEYLKLL
ncbi:mono/diheme cytochrome c family protein [Methanohalophilus levihalophilus]|uniref:c-type cytochrome n=1 Tax=Methanohalophilus levihalophilus TaxID=1431282 RepID=UPI001AE71C78|nr:cytochrome c [Methanohalophilus levihalophilus]MBP2030800.1 mono/diheme cytochrome c family protein [Methanohalophilus levihalophilus]